MKVHVQRDKKSFQPSDLGVSRPPASAEGDWLRQETATIPTRGSTEAAGHDLYAFLPEELTRTIRPLTVEKVPTGIRIAVEAGSVVLGCTRSGLASKGVQVVNAPGVIDSDYRGELFVLLIYIAPPDAEPFRINHGDRIGQLLFLPPGIVQPAEFEEVSDINLVRPTDRGAGGFGSTGR